MYCENGCDKMFVSKKIERRFEKMAKKEMTQKILKEKLKELDRKDLEKMICNMYKECVAAEQFINVVLLGDEYIDRLLAEYKEKLNKIFFPKDIVRSGFSLRQAKSILKMFKNVCQDPIAVAEMSLYFAECGAEFTNMYGDIDDAFYDALGDALEAAVDEAEINQDFYQENKPRFENIERLIDVLGWGMDEFVDELYSRIPWEEEK